MMGLPLPECFQPISANLSGALLANTRQTSSWSSARMLTQNEPDAWTLGHDDDCLPAQKSTLGGSSDREANEPIAMPTGVPSATAVMTVTPVGKWPRTWRYLAESNADPPVSSWMMSVTRLVLPGWPPSRATAGSGRGAMRR